MTALRDESEELRERDRNPNGDDEFVWCTAASLTDATGDEFDEESEDEFEWAPPLLEQSSRASATTSAALDPTLVTSRRLPARDDDAVARLAALKRDPTSGRWRRVESVFAETVETD